MQKDVTNDVIKLKEKYREKWRDRSQWYWAWRLCQEVAELIGSLLHIHHDSVDWELMQISTIGMNWLEMREAASLSNTACRRQILESPNNDHLASHRPRARRAQ